MANLPSISQRLNDIEVSANAPLTETLMRRIGSNINLLLDFLGIANGETSPSGDLQDLITAISTVSNHTISLEATIPNANATTNVGTYPSIKFLDRVFYYRIAVGYVTGLFMPLKNVDSGGDVSFSASKTLPPSVTAVGTGVKPIKGSTGLVPTEIVSSLTTSIVQGSPYRQINSGLFTDYEDIMRAGEWVILGTLDWREGTSTDVKIQHQIAASAGDVYMGYKLNIESAPLTF